MADWRERAKAPAKFRGVPFWVESTDRSGGRRGPSHEYFGKDGAFEEDTGRKPRPITIEGFVEGADYIAKRDALIAALENKSEPGELVHPTHGTSRRVCRSFRQRESTGTGGRADFSIEFAETAAKSAQPSAVVDGAAKLQASAAAARTAAGVSFLANYSPGTLLGSVTTGLASASSAINGVLGKVQMGVQAAANLRRQVEALESDAVALANVPANLLTAQLGIFEALSDGLIEATDPTGLISPLAAVLTLYGYDPGVRPPATTANRIAERACYDAAQHLTQRLVLIEAAVVAVEQTFASYEDAQAARDSITALLDDQIETVADDAYPALVQLRADLVRAIPGDALDLPRLVTHTPAVTVPSLVLAHRLYGNVDKEADMIARNQIRNPAFVTGGVALEVLSDGS